MTIDEQLRDLARRAEEHQQVITTDEIVRRVSSGAAATTAPSRRDDQRPVLERMPPLPTGHETSTIDTWRSGQAKHRRAPMRIALAGLLVASVVGIAVIRSNDHTSPADQPSTTLSVLPTTPPSQIPTPPPPDTTGVPATTTPPGWSGPVRDASAVVWPMAAAEAGNSGASWQDPLDAAESWVDIETVGFVDDFQAQWNIDLATAPPPPADRDAGLNIAYGLVLDTTGDGDADYLIGLDDAAPVPGEKRVWVTDLATGETDEQIGPPYGRPIEFHHPDERMPGDPPGQPELYFTFLGGSRPADLDGNVRFYAWTSATLDGEVIAWDYAPDIGWITPAPLEPTSQPWTVNALNQAIGPAATAWLQSGGAGDSPEAFALRDAARAVVLTLDDRALPDDFLKNPDGAWSAEYHLELLAGCSTSAGTKSAVCQDYPTISQTHTYRTLASLKLDLPDLGTLLFAGSYVVGDSIQPGRYETIWPVENCQWTTRDADGGINDGGYFESEQQLEMIVRSSDSAVRVVPECGVWRLAD